MSLAVWGERALAKRSALCAIGVALAVLGTARNACALPPGGCEPAQRFRLQNGLEVVLVADRALPAVAVLSSVHVGERNDPKGYRALARYVEHLTFRTSPPFTRADDLYLQLGAVDINSSISWDTSDYFAVVPSAHLEQALWIEARRLAIGLDTVTPESAIEEGRVMMRGRSQRRDNLADTRWGLVSASFLLPGHPYRHEIRTQRSDASLELANAQWFFARYYRPERVRLIVVGDFETERAATLISALFGRLKARVAEAPKLGSPAFDTTPEVTCADWSSVPPTPVNHYAGVLSPLRLQTLKFVWAFSSTEDPERWRAVLTFFAQRVQDAGREAGLVNRALVDLQPLELGSFWTLTVEVPDAHKPREAEPLVQKIYRQIIERRLSPEDDTVLQQALETREALQQKSLLERAKDLAVRYCAPVECAAPRRRVGLEDFPRLARERALVIEEQWRPWANSDGYVFGLK